MTRPDVSTERSARIEGRIRDALAALGPMPHFAWVRAELVEFRAGEGVAVLRLAGSCPDCDLTAATLREGIEAHLRMRVPEVREIVAVD
jgi:Fe-S cluster biogenesis protein NfuA